MTEHDRPPRVLHIVESIDRGSVESWLAGMYKFGRQSSRPIDWTFYCLLPEKGRREDELVRAGARVVRSPCTVGKPLDFTRHLRRFVRSGRFDVVHAHHDILSGLHLLAIAGLRVRRRVVHVHNADLTLPTPSRLKAALFAAVFRRVIRRQADLVVGISRYVLENFLDVEGVPSSRGHVLLCGVDAEPILRDADGRDRVRHELGLDATQTVLLFVGRLTWFKNPVFVVDVLAELRKRNPTAVAIFAGAGPMETAVRERAAALGVDGAVRVLGWRDDSAALMSAADVFVFPREEVERDDVGKEGLGLVVVEAQMAGLPLIVTRGLPDEAFVIPELFSVLSLSAGPTAWAEAVERVLTKRRMDVAHAVARVNASEFSMQRAFDALMSLHAV